jgi:acetoin utilization deacetylase AcuC-like enzyme
LLKIAFHPIYKHPLPEGHRFPMIKYELIPEQLIYEGTCTKENFFEPQIAESESILNVHDKKYLDDLLNINLNPKVIRKIGFPLSKELVTRELIITQGTIDCTHFAFENRISLNIAGGTHHAYSNRGEGFCLLNDVAVAAANMLKNKLSNRILIIDLDVHQGNGTAEIFQNWPNVFTFSMHGKDNYPLQKEKSNLDIELKTNCNDQEYLNLLEANLPKIIKEFKPDFLFYISGVDILETDKLGKLSVSKEACKRRDEFVFENAILNKLPIVVSMGGGYSPQIKDIIEAHCNTFRLASKMFF